MEPLFTNLKESDLSKEDILFYQFNFTDKPSQHQTKLMAGALDVDWVLMNNTGTGFILLVDVESKKVLYKITKDFDLKMASNKIKEKLRELR